MSAPSDRGTKRPKKPSKVIREPVGDMVVKDCGCQEQPFNDETKDEYPCMPHALQKAASCLVDAGNALGYVGFTLEQQEARNRAMAELNKKVDDLPEPPA